MKFSNCRRIVDFSSLRLLTKECVFFCHHSGGRPESIFGVEELPRTV